MEIRNLILGAGEDDDPSQSSQPPTTRLTIMRLVSAIIVSLLIMSLAGGALAGAKGKVYGKGVAAEDTVLVSTLLANPDAYVGQTIRVKGTAVGVCAHRGCWINIASDKEGDTVRIKVKDGEIVFPPEIMGDTVIAEGVWTANTLDMETTKEYCAAQAREKGEKFDEHSVTSCMTLYQLSGTGAVVAAK
jgi:hypothetical protein